MNRARHTCGAFAAVTTVALLAGCSTFSAQTTTLQYTPSDGAQTDLGGGVGIRNAIVLSEGSGAEAALVGVLVNSGTEDATVDLSSDDLSGLDTTVDVPAGESVMLGPDDEDTEPGTTDLVPGRLAYLILSSEVGEATLPVPVLDGSLPEYADLVPDASES